MAVRKWKNRSGFTLVEVMIAFSVMIAVFAGFAVMIKVAGNLIADNKRDLQRNYTMLTVLDVVRAYPVRYTTTEMTMSDLRFGTTDVLYYPAGQTLAANGKDWRARIKKNSDGVSYSVYVDAQDGSLNY